MKKRALGMLMVLSGLSGLSGVSMAEHCPASYMGKQFNQVTIWSDISGMGPAECDFKNKGDKKMTVSHFPKIIQYHKVSGNWLSTMPGYQWCNVDGGGSYDSCEFAG